ncbi:hypothetical protein ASPWEDRAFT_22222 [Aspergillus wentii DTO 134E9]|uniref:Tyrosine specific protein phosphatases domain-containing protein n=1 Tax=Aspergillus wentii DTO 134E9 TaxID=1073089 RepID=A0A1L9RYF8_ASPWE|nr:uncharacterized protein ASPWEDRAFT_22222 [Aspergillus wentii DTO 134E9]KAI9932439.1 hypothetical protein MW887_008680 [Aspergillus wentii]OJJ40006.1 hypothetical protein ASPWEDRAFT_22222 [Aspergillus wentii DTO 134E9]
MGSTIPSIDLIELSKSDINVPIPADILNQALSCPPFQEVSGAFNLRDIAVPGAISPGIVYRSGILAHLTEEGKLELLSKLGIGLILDLRSERETKSHPPPNVPGIKTVWLPTYKAPSPLSLDSFIGENGGEIGYTQMYLEILDLYAESFRVVLEYLRDEATQGRGVLFHCFAGKDRTGVLASIILSLAGVPDSEIAKDYALTRIGIESQREFLLQLFLKYYPGWTDEAPGVQEFFAIKQSYMLSFLDAARKEYGGLTAYVKSRLGFSEGDIEKIRSTLRGA